MEIEGSSKLQKQNIFHHDDSWCHVSETKGKTKELPVSTDPSSSPFEKKPLKDCFWSFVNGVFTLISVVSYTHTNLVLPFPSLYSHRSIFHD